VRPNLRRVHVHFVYAYVILILVLCGVSCPLIFPRKTMFGSSLLAFVLYVVHALFVLFVFMYLYKCPTRFPYQMRCVSFYSNTTGGISGTGTNLLKIRSTHLLFIFYRFFGGVFGRRDLILIRLDRNRSQFPEHLSSSCFMGVRVALFSVVYL
jgi:hypothetical protein